MNFKEIIDISLPLEKGMITYPNNPPFNISPVRGAASQLHKFSLGTHTGTHVDAPNHVIDGAPGIDFYPLSDFIGTCRVIDCTKSEGVITLDDVKDAVIKKGDRILLKTKNSDEQYDEFREDFIALSPEAAEFLASHDLSLIGIDYLSIKKRGAEENVAHTAFLSRGIPILEGIMLRNVQPGSYTIVVLPLKLLGVDGSPCRAVLLR
jgi:arylformamidase